MEHVNTLKERIQIIVGKPLSDINLACEMMMFSFGDYELHSQCFTRIILDQQILATTLDYQNWDGENESNNDEWFFIAKHKAQIVGGVVLSVEITPLHDVMIHLDNGVRIELYIANGFHHHGEEREQWVFFNHRDHSYPFIGVNSKSFDIASE